LLLTLGAAAARVGDEFARLTEAYQAGAQHTRFPCIDKTDDRNVIGGNRPTVLAPAQRRRRRRRGARGAEIAHMNPNQLGAFLQAEAARFHSLLKNSRVSRATP
jgi:hypothetical protein